MLGWLALAAACAAPQEDFERAWVRANRGREDMPAGEHERARPATATGQGEFGAQWLWAAGKMMPGVLAGVTYELVRFDFETSLIALTEPSAEFDSQLLGSQFGFHAMVRPFYADSWELAAGLGADGYSLWNLHGDLFEVALSVRAAGHVWLSRRFGVFATARAYPVATSGLELGTARDLSAGIPVLFGTGVAWRFQ
jgi:hypothetical protein